MECTNNVRLATVVKQAKESIIIKIHLSPRRLNAVAACIPGVTEAIDNASIPTFCSTTQGLVNNDQLDVTSTIETGIQSPVQQRSDAVEFFGQEGLGLQTQDKMGTSGSSTPVRFYTPAPWGWQTPPHGPPWSELGDVQSIQDGEFDGDDFELPHDCLEGSRASPTDQGRQSDPGPRYDAYRTIPYHQSFEPETSPSRPTVSPINPSQVAVNLDHAQEAKMEFDSNAVEGSSTLDGSAPKLRLIFRDSPSQPSFQQPPRNKKKGGGGMPWKEEEETWVLHYLQIELANGTKDDLKWVHISENLTKHGLERSPGSVQTWWFRHGRAQVKSDKSHPLYENVSKEKNCMPKKKIRSDAYDDEEKQLILKCMNAEVATGSLSHTKWKHVSERLAKIGLRRLPQTEPALMDTASRPMKSDKAIPQQLSPQQIGMVRKRQMEGYEGDVDILDSVENDEQVRGLSSRRTGSRPVRPPKRYRVTESI
ncbi:MAG: hypothetical protein Q9200_004764 [Gallowayella weberi]